MTTVTMMTVTHVLGLYRAGNSNTASVLSYTPRCRCWNQWCCSERRRLEPAQLPPWLPVMRGRLEYSWSVALGV